MDQRQPPPPQLPYSSHSGPTSAFPRHPLPPTAPTATASNSPPNHPAFSAAPPAPHAPTTSVRYFEHQRHLSDSHPYPPPSASYTPDVPNPNPNPNPNPSYGIPTPSHANHSRHQSSSSISSAPPALSRAMAPSGSPSQPPPQQPPPSQQHQPSQQGQHSPSQQMGHYGLPHPMPPPGPSRQPSSFPPGRELPPLNSIARAGSTGSSMSISSMLGGSFPAHRDPQQQPQHQQQQHPQQQPHYPPSSTPSSSATFGPTIHASPRMHSTSTSTSADFPPFRRPQTPEQPRPYDPRGGSTGASPQANQYTPEVQRYGTPQYHRGAPPVDQGRDARISAPAIPPRPSSQPKSFPNAASARPLDHGRPGPSDDVYSRRENPMRRSVHAVEYNPERTGLKPIGYDDRYGMERMERDREMDQRERERERRERTLSMGDNGRPHPAYADYGGVGQRSQQPQGVGHQEHRDPRDHQDIGHWQRQAAYDPARAPYESPGPQQRHPEDLPTSGPPYSSHPAPAYSQPPPDRYPPHTQGHYPGPAPQSTSGPPPSLRYDTSPDQQRLGLHPHQQGPPSQPQPHPHMQQQQLPPHRPRPHEEEHQGSPYGPSNHPISLESSRSRSNDEPPTHHPQNRGHLAVQEINRSKGRVSPLPQAVQGAQPQLPGPAGEPGIKSEFGRVFSGLGGGIGGLGVSSPVTSAPPASSLPFPGTHARREDADSGAHDSGPDGAGKGGNRGRRRKLKEEDPRDEDATGRLTPSGRAKRPKTMPHHHHQYDSMSSANYSRFAVSTNLNHASSHHHHHHHHHHNQDGTPQPGHAGTAPFKGPKGTTPVPSPTGPPKDGMHHNHNHTSRPNPQNGQSAAKPAPSPMPVIPPKPKQVVNSKAVIDSVAGRPRYHLGDVLYDPSFQPARLAPNVPSRRGYSTTPNPLPLDKISGKENCTLTVKVAKIHLTPTAREEITSRRAVWGTEVYTDDSDVVAACIHGGWIRGEWPDDVDVALLDLDHGIQNDGVVEKESRRKKDREAEAKARLEANAANFLSAPPRTGPVHVPADRDLHVTLVVLPKLQKYTSTTRFGIQSREFGGDGRRQPRHDGLSFMVTGVRWVENGARPQSQLRGKARRERMRRAMRDVGVSFKGVNGMEAEAGRDAVGRLRGELERAAIGDGEKDGGGARGEAEGHGEFDKENRPAEGGEGGVNEEDRAEKGDKGTEVES